jgi:hypothetical protein
MLLPVGLINTPITLERLRSWSAVEGVSFPVYGRGGAETLITGH